MYIYIYIYIYVDIYTYISVYISIHIAEQNYTYCGTVHIAEQYFFKKECSCASTYIRTYTLKMRL